MRDSISVVSLLISTAFLSPDDLSCEKYVNSLPGASWWLSVDP